MKVEKLTGLSRSTIYARIKDGTFPRPVPLGERAVAWLETEISEWQQQCVAARDGDADAGQGAAVAEAAGNSGSVYTDPAQPEPRNRLDRQPGDEDLERVGVTPAEAGEDLTDAPPAVARALGFGGGG